MIRIIGSLAIAVMVMACDTSKEETSARAVYEERGTSVECAEVPILTRIDTTSEVSNDDFCLAVRRILTVISSGQAAPDIEPADTALIDLVHASHFRFRSLTDEIVEEYYSVDLVFSNDSLRMTAQLFPNSGRVLIGPSRF